MKKTLKLLSFLLFGFLSFVYSEEQEYLSEFDHRFGLELDLMGLSYHTNRNYDFNEVNPGIGLSFTLGSDVVDDGNSAVLVASFGTYKNSYDGQANYFLVGPRGTLGYREHFHVSGAIQAGYIIGFNQNGSVIVPVLSVGYNRFDLCITGNPFEKDEDNESKFIACFLKIRVLDW